MDTAEEIRRRTLTYLLDEANKFYANPENRKAYEEWAKTEEAKEYEKLFKR